MLLGLGFLFRLDTELGLLLSDFLLCLLLFPNFFCCCLSSSSSLVTRLSTGETGELELSSISCLKKCKYRGNAFCTFESVVGKLNPTGKKELTLFAFRPPEVLRCSVSFRLRLCFQNSSLAQLFLPQEVFS